MADGRSTRTAPRARHLLVVSMFAAAALALEAWLSWLMPSENPFAYFAAGWFLLVSALASRRRIEGARSWMSAGLLLVGLLSASAMLQGSRKWEEIHLCWTLATLAVAFTLTWSSASRQVRRMSVAIPWLVAFSITPLPFYMWPWAALRADVRQLRDESLEAVRKAGLRPGPGLAPDEQERLHRAGEMRRIVFHPLFRFTIPLHISYIDGRPLIVMGTGGGRFTYVDPDAPMSFGHASD